jgi:cytochrome P450
MFCAVTRLLFGVDAQHLSGAFVEASHFAEECWANGLFTQPSSSPCEMEKHYHAAVQTQEGTAAWIAEEAGIGIQDQSVKQAIVRILLNGYNATATTLCWVIYVIMRHSEVRAKVYGEIDASAKNTKIKKSDNVQLHYLRMVVKETLRLYPPAWILGREALDNDWLGSTFIPKGSRVLVSPYTMQRHSQLWENPGQFIPERFNSHSSIKPFTYFPFGGGERKCPASRFVLSHLHVLISVLVDSSHIEIAATEPIRPRGLIALHPQPNVLVLATPRKSKFSLMV